MRVKLTVLSIGVMFFTGQALTAQESSRKDTLKTTEIEDIIVVGYGKVNRQTFVGTADQVSMASVDSKNVSTVSQALAGEAPGVRIITPSGQPGEEAKIRIRGFSSINGNREPMYIVDGAPYDSYPSAINMDDIASLVILKDATATAIYGARGANGVVVITTKVGRSGKQNIQIESKIGVNLNLLPRYDVIKSPEEYMEMSWQALKTGAYISGVADPATFANQNLVGDKGINPYYFLWNVNPADMIDPATGKVRPGVAMARKYNPEDWEKYAFKPGMRSENNFTISGGEGKTNYYTSLGYLKDEGYSINSSFERYTARLNLNYQPKDWLTSSFNFGYALSKIKNAGQTNDSGSIFWFVDNIPSIYPLYFRDPDGNTIPANHFGGYEYDYGNGNNRGTLGTSRGFGMGANSIADALYDINKRLRHQFDGNVFFDAKLFDFLHFETQISGQYYIADYDNLGNPFYGGSASQGGSVYKTKTENLMWSFLQLLRFNKTYSKHTIEAFAAHESNSDELKYMSAFSKTLVSPDIPEFNNTITPVSNSSFIRDYTLESFFGQLSYDYAGKYLASFAVRRDGSSRFIRNRWDTFASAGIGWVLTKENFMQNQSFLKNLKLKASYGTTGDQMLDQRDQYVYLSYYPGYPEWQVGSLNGETAATYVRSGYPDLTWERINKLSGGVEFSLFKGVIEGNVDIYHYNTKNLIFDKRESISTGVAINKFNSGQLINKGLEFDVTGHIFKKKDFYLDLNINGEVLKNTLTKMPWDEAAGRTKIIDISEAGFGRAEGHSVYDFYMREWAGVNPQTGAAQWYVNYVDANGNGQYDPGEQLPNNSLLEYQQLNPDVVIKQGITEVYTEATERYVGKSAIPDLRGGINFSVGYKGFSIRAQILYSFGGYAYDYTYATLMGNSVVGNNNYHKDMHSAWQNPGDITNVPRLTSNLAISSQNIADGNFNAESSRFLTKTDYFLLNNLTLGYSVPSEYLESIGVNSLQLTLSGDNLWLHSKRKGFNPLTSESGNVSSYTYMPLSSFTFGVKVNF